MYYPNASRSAYHPDSQIPWKFYYFLKGTANKYRRMRLQIYLLELTFLRMHNLMQTIASMLLWHGYFRRP